jgi:hypothetical protein
VATPPIYEYINEPEGSGQGGGYWFGVMSNDPVFVRLEIEYNSKSFVDNE